MKPLFNPLRLLYIASLTLNIALSSIFFYQYRLANESLERYRLLSRHHTETLQRLRARLIQNQKELLASQAQAEALNQTIASLAKDNLTYTQDLKALRDERQKLQIKIATLTQEKDLLQKQLSSVEDLKEALKLARKDYLQRYQKRRQAKIAMLKQLDEIALKQGNRGFLTKDGETTFKMPRIRVELESISKLP